MNPSDLASSSVLDKLDTNVKELIPNIPVALVTLLAGILVIRVISWIAWWIIGFIRMPKGLKEIIISMLDALLAIFLTIVVLQSLGLNNVALVFSAFVAAAGIAIGSGSSSLIADILAGVYLAKDTDFRIGDTLWHLPHIYEHLYIWRIRGTTFPQMTPRKARAQIMAIILHEADLDQLPRS